ncbi:DUF1640 domain-containing protein [Candidatus Williamhamiltonella defendens]|uniref:DUF1640 domain-containing protein n=3 Tax=Candidatus Williamhamiltonella defendens TaxID=138072 RepID=A0A2D3TER8_9ENTR|nr:hypothetical protein [Candidatus Hamiltonella defensa]ACQ68562.1 conserved hypothetical phage protein [Candidatus Hamiltonella defensa 5AT (Acyrthosiphon pisum)]ATW23104.1 DUF1640 domain-containing protein [Candidatus Hamiltonella defensa]ATW30760.1 DUF1640 domain-containing protein [Candidatus Hamiltonella defensa]ATW32742.1 DUF1640 domain-containing protein [Candidatus Hamiltonella defensa]ATW34320.1 DUF1640 domain-containing protein [Candidatus Hamiltonella defensa]
MAQVAFDTLQATEDLETVGMSREHARAISLIVRRSHEVADVATKADIADVKRDIADVRKDMDTRFEKVDAQFADIRKDMDTRFEKVDVQFADIRKDMDNKLEKLGLSLTIKMGGMIGFLVVSIGLMLKYLR